MFSRMGSAAFKKDLTNIRILCERLDNPHTKFKTIHVGGTNGKGSVSHMLSAVLQTARYKTGLYTSPHLYDFRERIRINGQMVDENFVIDFVKKIRPVIEEIEPSFFEITVAMAFEYFAQQKIDIAVIEVGLGGRLDSTNIITPELSVITNIGWDHMNMLGNTLQEIAVEKAGIIKESIPAVIGETKNESAGVFYEMARQKNTPIFFADEHCKLVSHKWENGHLFVELLNTDESQTSLFELDLPGLYQQKNLCTVITSLDVLKKIGFPLSDEEIHEGLKKVIELTGLKGRWEVIHQNPSIVLEVAHNQDGIAQMLQHLKYISYSHLHVIFGIVKDKEIAEVLRLLPREASYYFTQAHIPRALPATELLQKAQEFSLNGLAYDDVNEALQQALNNAAVNDLVIVCGSIFLVAEVSKESILHPA